MKTGFKFICAVILVFLASNVYPASIDERVAEQRKRDVITGDNETVSREHLRRFAERDHTPFTVGSFVFDGFLRFKYENAKTYDGVKYSFLRTYLNLNMLNVGVTGLSLHFYGDMQNSLKNADEDLDLYYGYIRYKTFQNAVDIKAGRFELINNNFMTVDGGQVTFITPAYFGVTLYGGVPYYKNFEDRKEVFRDTGDLIYGGRVFLSGIESVSAYIGYSRETGKNSEGRYGVFSEILSAGGYYVYDMSSDGVESYASVNAVAEYDPFHGALSRLSGKANYRRGMFELVAFGDIFDIRDQYPKGRELIIRLLSTGKEMRYGGDAAFNPADWISIYGGVYGTTVEVNSGSNIYGAVYKAGFDLYFMKYAGLMFAGEFYYYDTGRYDALGGALSGEWRVTQDLSFILSGELASLKDGVDTINAYAVNAELTLHITRFLTASVFYEKGEKNRFIDDMRCGATVKYDF